MLDEYDYDLPADRIAQVPAEPRSSARLLVALAGQAVAHHTVSDLPTLVEPGDVLVVNETMVIPARLRMEKATGGAVEVLLLEQIDGDRWEALVRPGRRVPPGTLLQHAGRAAVEVGDRLDDGRRVVRFCDEAARRGLEHLDALGTVPLPPYIHEPLADPGRYQTVYARVPGSVAAPTAGLHLTPEVLAGVRERGATVATVNLSVGLDTFRPIAVDDLDEHRMHSERYDVPQETVDACDGARRVIAVGTTTVRALESAALTGDLRGRTDLFIRPGFRFRAVDVLLTNFHTPRSSLLVLLAAFAGDRWRQLYETALSEGYRFLSFGDAMLVGRQA